ncbi:uncharacterized protein LOC132920798, partial [Rhopalosiphum padi]
RRSRTVYTSDNGRGGVVGGVAVVIGNDTAAGPTSPLLQTATPPTPPLLVGQTNVTGGGGGGGVVVVVGGGGGGEGPFDGGYWWWALLAVFLVLATAAGNILVCLAITWERRLQNVTNYFLMSLAVTDLMVAVLVMPVGILTLVKGVFPFAPVYCLAWICLDVLFCTASIMHLCTISVDRYLSLRYPMKFGRNKTRRRVILKIVFVWLLSIAMSLPLSLMYSKDFNSVLVNGSCQIPDPLYKLIGSIVSFYIPLGVMILTYTLTVRHLAAKRQNLQTGFTHNSNQNNTARRSWRRMLRRNYRRTRSDETDVRSATGEELTGVMTSSADGGGGRKQKSRGDPTARPNAMKTGAGNGAPSSSSRSTAAAEDDSGAADSVDNSPRSGHHYRHHHRPVTPSASCRGTPRPFRHNPSVGSTDTEMTSLDARELWLPDTEPTPSTMSALHQFGAEMLRLSRGLEKVASPESKPASPDTSRLSVNGGGLDDDDDDDGLCDVDDIDDEEEDEEEEEEEEVIIRGVACDSMCSEDASTCTGTPRCRRVKRQRRRRRRRSGTLHESMRRRFDGPNHHRHLHHHHHLHPYYHHPHHDHQSHHPHQGRPTRVRSFHEDELTSNRAGPASAAFTGTAAADSGPKIVGTLLKQEYQRKPGLDEEICLLPPPPRRRQRRGRSPSANSCGGDDSREATAAAVTSSSPVSTAQPARATPPPQGHPQQQQTAARVDTLTVWSAASNKSKTTTLAAPAIGGQPLRRAMTQKPIRKQTPTAAASSATGKRHSPLVRYGSTLGLPSRQQQPVTPQRSNNANRSSVMIRNSYRHGRIIRLEQKATKVLGVVFFTFVFLWTPFFALNLLPSVCPNCEADISKGLIDLVTWLGYASSMVNPVFYTIFNKVFRQAFKRVLMCKYRGRSKRHSWPPPPPARKV